MKIIRILALFLMLFTAFNPEVKAEENPVNTEREIIEIEIQDSEGPNRIKEKILSENGFFQQLNDQQQQQFLNNAQINLAQLDPCSLEIQDVLVTISCANMTITQSVFIQFVDNEAPEVSFEKEDYYFGYGEEIDLQALIYNIEDNSGQSEFDIQISTDLDIRSIGDYAVEYTVTDLSGNTTTEEITVHVRSNSMYGEYATLLEEMLMYFNQERAAYGLNPVVLVETDAATIRAEESAEYGYNHRRPNGDHYKTIFIEENISASNPLEILTYAGSTVIDKFNWWCSSTNHHKIILSPTSTKVTIGFYGQSWCAIFFE